MWGSERAPLDHRAGAEIAKMKTRSPETGRLEQALIGDPGARRLSNYTLAARFGVHFQSVRRARHRLESAGLMAAVPIRVCADGIERNVTGIGRR